MINYIHAGWGYSISYDKRLYLFRDNWYITNGLWTITLMFTQIFNVLNKILSSTKQIAPSLIFLGFNHLFVISTDIRQLSESTG